MTAREKKAGAVTAEEIAAAIAKLASSGEPLPERLLVEMLLDQEWLMAGRLPPRYATRKGKQGETDPEIVRMWQAACLYDELCAKGIIRDEAPAETIAEQFDCTVRHISQKVLPNPRYRRSISAQMKFFRHRYGDELSARIARTLMEKVAQRYRETHKKREPKK